MTTISESRSAYIDLASFALDDEALHSLAAADDDWRSVTQQMAASIESPHFRELLAVGGDLVARLGDADWQQRWLYAWHKLSGRGVPMAEKCGFFFSAVDLCEPLLLGGAGQVSRVRVELFSLLRRAVTAAVCCAVEMGEAARAAENAVPGEQEALRALRELVQAGRPAAVLSLFLSNRNHYAQISAGDLQALPARLANRLSAVLRPDDRVFSGREGEWLLVLPDVVSMAQPGLAAAHVRRVFEDPVRLSSGRRIVVDVTLGGAMLPEHANDPEQVVHAARLARWNLEGSGQPFGWFRPEQLRAWRERMAIVDELRQAMHSETMQLYLQPQVDIDRDACVGAELLLRWQRGNGEWVPPPRIVEMIEENGWRAMFTDWLIRSAMRISGELAMAGVDIRLSINLTASDLLDADLPEMLAHRLATWHLPPSRFALEITESAMMGDRERCLAVMHGLRDKGLHLALDDFGTGYSSLSYLAHLPVDEVKIDRSFVVEMFKSAEGLRVVRAIIDLARDLGMEPLAEGVEDIPHREQLRALGCKLIQGYLYAKPMPMAAFIDWYRQREG